MGYEAGLEAFQQGDFARAAQLWRDGYVPSQRDGYTLQVLAACEISTLERLRTQVQPSGRLFVVPTEIGGRRCYRVAWGVYADPAAAEAALSGVPPYFTAGGGRPVPVSMARLAR